MIISFKMRVTSETVLVLVLIHLAFCDDIVHKEEPIITSPILASTSLGKEMKKAKEFPVLKVIATGNKMVEPSNVTEVNQPIYVQKLEDQEFKNAIERHRKKEARPLLVEKN